MPLRLVTDATAEPVSLDDIKLHMGIDATEVERDDWFTGVIKASRKLAENKMRRLCLPQTWKLTLDDFRDEMILPRAPLSTASTNIVITYLDSASGDSTTLASTCYRVDYESEPGRILLGYDSEWPDVYGVKNAVSIQFVAGYPLTTDLADTCPEAIETWIKMRVAGLYEMKESHGEKGLQELPHSFLDGLLDPYVLIEVGP